MKDKRDLLSKKPLEVCDMTERFGVLTEPVNRVVVS